MKKILILTITGLFAITIESYAGFYDNQTNSNGTTGTHGTLYGNPTATGETSGGGLFRSDIPSPGGRPDSGSGIGQGSVVDPIGDGIEILIFFVVLLGITKFIYEKSKKYSFDT
jgi:hypothetical protein